MSDKLTDSTPDVKGEQTSLLHTPTTEEFDARADEVLALIRQFRWPLDRFALSDQLHAALLATAAVESFVRNGSCMCVTCVEVYANGNPLLAVCVRARILLATGQPSRDFQHMPLLRLVQS